MFCRKCGYNLASLIEHRCPECARAFDPNRPRTYFRFPKHQRRWVWALVVATWIAAAAFPYLVYRVILGGYTVMADHYLYSQISMTCATVGAICGLCALVLGTFAQRVAAGIPLALYGALLVFGIIAEWLH